MEILNLSPAKDIIEGLPVSCRPCPLAQSKANELSYWVNDGRLEVKRAANLILELVGCDFAQGEQLPEISELTAAH